MAKRVKLQQAFADPDEDTDNTADVTATEEQPAPVEKPAAATKKTSAKKAASVGKRGSTKKAATAKRSAGKKATEAEPKDDTTDVRTPRAQIRVKGAATTDAEKFLLYVHRDYWKALELAKIDDKVDRQSRIRAMIALWNEDPIFRAAVDRIAAKAPRGQY